MQRKISFFLVREDNQFKLRVIQINREEMGGGHIDRMIRYMLGYEDAIDDTIYLHVSRFNNIQPQSHESHELYKTYTDSHQSHEFFSKSRPQFQSEYFDFSLLLPTDEKKLLMLLGSLDGAIHSFQGAANENKHIVSQFLIWSELPDFAQMEAIIDEVYSGTSKKYSPLNSTLSRIITSWMIAELGKQPEESVANQALLATLQQLLTHENASLTRAIREKIYPDPSIEDFIASHCKPEETLMGQMLNPAVALLTKSNALLDFLRLKLRAKEHKPAAIVCKTEQPVAIHDVAVSESPAALPVLPVLEKHPIHIDMTNWFKRFEELREQLWHEMITTLYGRPAVDGGCYSANYTEVSLLRQSKIFLNQNSLFEISFKDTDSYKRHYAKGRKLHDILEKELRQACTMLDLEFLPDQDFHHKMVFTPESTAYLMRCGFHYNENYCKDLLRADNKFQFFHRSDYNIFKLLPADIRVYLMKRIEPALHETEIKLYASKK